MACPIPYGSHNNNSDNSNTSVASAGLAVLSSRYLTTSMWFSWAAMYSGVKPVYNSSRHPTINFLLTDITLNCHVIQPQPFYDSFFQDHPGEPAPEANFWTLWCKGRLTEADTSGLTSAHLHHSFLQAGCPSCRPTNSVKALKATSAFRLGRDARGLLNGVTCTVSVPFVMLYL